MRHEQNPEERLREILKAMQKFEHNPQGEPWPYKILLSGDLNSGKTTLRKEFAKRLGFEEIYTGGVMREMAALKGTDIVTFFRNLDSETEKEIDRRQIQLMLEKPWIIFEGRIAPWVEEVAQALGVELTNWEFTRKLRLYLAVSPEEGARRAQGRTENKGKSIEQLLSETRARIADEKKHYLDLYGLAHHTDKSRFDIVLDTTSLTQGEVLEEAHLEVAEWTKRNLLK